MEEIEIQELPLANYDELTTIVEQQQLFHYHLNGPYSERFLRINAMNFKQFMEKKALSITYIARSITSKEIVGFTSAYINHHQEGSIEDLFVREDFRSKQIGKLLFEKLLTWLEKNKADTIDVHVSIGNEAVLSFYEKFGFHKAGYTLMKKNDNEE